jgi:N-acetylglucosamine-6-phosphate deacetylase
MTDPARYFDLQVNGYGGIDYNQDDLSPDDLHLSCERLHSDGVGSILATVVTERAEKMVGRIRRLAQLRERDPLAREVIAGIHVEGPFISPVAGYPGGHPLDAICKADIDIAKQFLDAGDGLVRLVTLAPEQDDRFEVTRFLAAQGIVVSAGHTDASPEHLRGAIDAGLSMVTHLGNGCPGVLPRHDNIIQRALSLADSLWLCFIADGVHIPFFALRNYLKLAGIEHSIVVTDAISAAGLGPGLYKTARWEVLVGDDKAARAPDGSHLLGSAMAMKDAFGNLTKHVGLSADDALRLTSTNPRSVLR